MRKIISTISIILGIYIFIFGLLQGVLSTNFAKNLITSEIQKETNIKLDIKDLNFKMKFPFSVLMSAKSISIGQALKLQNTKFQLRILPFLFKNLYVDKAYIENITAMPELSKDMDLRLGDLNIKNIKTPFNIKKINSETGYYDFELKDNFSNQTVSVKSDERTFINYVQNKNIKFITKGNVTSGKGSSNINFDIDLPYPNVDTSKSKISAKVSELNIGDFSSYINYFSNGKYEKSSGMFDFNAETIKTGDSNIIKADLALGNFGLYEKEFSKSIFHDGKLSVNSILNLRQNILEIKDLKILGDGISSDIRGNIKNISNEKRNMDLNITLNKSKTEKFITLLPAIEFEDVNLITLKENPFYGDIVGNLNINGNFKTPNITGNILVQNGYLIKPIIGAKGADIRLKFNKKVLNLDVNVPTADNQAVFVKGPIELYGSKNADLSITSTKNINLETASFVLNPLHDILKFIIGPVPIMSIKGSGNINLHIIGNKQLPHAFGEFNFSNATVSFNDIKDLIVTNGLGTLVFDNTNTVFKTQKAILNGKNITINGKCNLDGKFDFNVETAGQNSGSLLRTLKISPMLSEIGKMLDSIEYSTGLADLKLNIKGHVKDPKEMEFLKNVFASGNLKLTDNLVKIKNLPEKLSHLTGTVNFDNKNLDLNLAGGLSNSKFKLSGKVNDKKSNLTIASDKFRFMDLALALPKGMELPYREDLENIVASFNAKYTGSIDDIDFSKINLKGKIHSNTGNAKEFITNGTSFSLNNSEFNLANQKGSVKGNEYNVALNIKNIQSKNQKINGTMNFKHLDLSLVNDFIVMFNPYIPKEIRDLKEIGGKADITAKIVNNKIRAFTSFEDVTAEIPAQNFSLEIADGNVFLQDSSLNLNRLNSKLNGMPLFINGKISNIQAKNPFVDLYINAQPTQDFADKFINENSLYPLKIKGDIKLTSYIKGTINNLNTKSKVFMDKASNIYYMGSTIGDDVSQTELEANININPYRLKIDKFNYNKLADTLKGEVELNPQLVSNGEIFINKKNNSYTFKNLKLKTLNDVDARIFNIIFKKPIMKQGTFTSDIILNGSFENPKANGNLAMKDVDMPFYNSTISDVQLDIKNDKILAEMGGNFFSNDVHFAGVMKNKLIPPFIVEDVKLNLKDLNLDVINETLRDYEVEATRNKTAAGNSSQDLDLSMIVLNNAEINADKIKAKNISATDFRANVKFDKNLVLTIPDYAFTLAEGKISGEGYYNLVNHNAGMKMHLDNANAQIMAEALFDLKNQIFGNLTGDFDLTCDGKESDSCMKTLSGEGYFEITDGKMPKLGSLEYLLKAGNLLSGGLTGLSINGIIDLITPLKTGEFESVYGDFYITEGTAKKINVYSKGNDLNMYMTGSYNLSTAIADMRIFGSLSNKVTSVFSKIKSASLNTLLNTIPGINKDETIELLQNDIAKIPSEKNKQNVYKIFKAEINGDINGNSYVKSFKWIK